MTKKPIPKSPQQIDLAWPNKVESYRMVLNLFVDRYQEEFGKQPGRAELLEAIPADRGFVKYLL